MSNQRKRVTLQANLAIKFSYDVFCFVISSFLAFLIRFDFSFDVVVISFYRKYISITAITELILGIIFVLIYKTYRDIWHYTSIGEVYKLIRTTILEKLIFTFVIFSFSLIGFPKSIFFISPIITFILLVTPRLIGRLLKDERRNENKLQSGNNTLIIGAGDAGEKIIREIKAHPHLDYNVIGFIDDNPVKHGCYLQGVKVIGDTYSIPKLVEENDIKTILVAIPTAERSELKRIYDLTSKLPVKLLILPGIYEIIGGEVTISQIRPFGLEDLLFREQVKLITDRSIKRFNGARVLVTGACGSIGSSICKKLVELGSTVIAFDNNETGIFDLEMELNHYFSSFTTSSLTSFLPSSQDILSSPSVIPAKAGTNPSSQNSPYYPKFISDSNQPPSSPCIPIVGDIRFKEKLLNVMKDYRPTIVFHAAAYKHVPLMEAFPEEAIQNNIIGTMNVIEACNEAGVEQCIVISTDKAVEPNNVMGMTKRINELMVLSLNGKSNTKFSAVRFGNVLGSRGNVLEVWKKEFEKGEPLSITDPNMKRYFMLTEEAAALVIEASTLTDGGDILLLDMGKEVSMIELAKAFCNLQGSTLKEVGIKIIGIRPGEKLTEKLYLDDKKIEKTEHEKILS